MKFQNLTTSIPLMAGAALLLCLMSNASYAQGVGVNETGAVPNANAMLDVDAAGNDKGILIPRITSGQRTGIGGLGLGEEGLTVYDETTNSYWLWDGAQWIEFIMSGKAWELDGNAGTTAGTDFIGTTDAVDWVIKTNNTERVRVYSGGDVDLNDNTLYTRDAAGNTYGIGYGVEGGTEYTMFSDNLIQFTESDGDVQVMTIEGNNNRVEMFGTMDASGTTGSGVLEISNSLRIDGNEMITNTNTPLYLQNGNNGDLFVDATTLAVDASTNRVGVGTTTPTDKLTVAGWIGRTAHNNGALVGSYNSVGANSVNSNPIYAIGSNYYPASTTLANFYGVGYTHTNASFVNAGTGSWGMYVAADGDARIWLAASTGGDSYINNGGFFGLNTNAPTRALDVNGTVRIRGGGATAGDFLMSQDAAGNATWASSGYGLIPIGSIVGWHGNMAGVPGLPAGWLECNGQTIADGASPMNGVAVPNLNGATTSNSGDVSRGRFLRGNTTSGWFQTDQANNLDWVNHDDSGNGDTDDYLADEGGVVTIRNYSTSGDRFQCNVDGYETRPTNMTVRWIIRVK